MFGTIGRKRILKGVGEGEKHQERNTNSQLALHGGVGYNPVLFSEESFPCIVSRKQILCIYNENTHAGVSFYLVS